MLAIEILCYILQLASCSFCYKIVYSPHALTTTPSNLKENTGDQVSQLHKQGK